MEFLGYSMLFKKCRGCLASSIAADLHDLFEEEGENARKFQEFAGFDVRRNVNFDLFSRSS